LGAYGYNREKALHADVQSFFTHLLLIPGAPRQMKKGVESAMARKTVADLLVDTLAGAGVERMYEVSGDSLNGIIYAIRRHEQLRWMPVRHGKVVAFAVSADAHLSGRLAVCAGSCGPSNIHLINGLYDCHRSRVPILAIAAQIPSPKIGSAYFQETHPEHLFAHCSHYCELVSQPEQMPGSWRFPCRPHSRAAGLR